MSLQDSIKLIADEVFTAHNSEATKPRSDDSAENLYDKLVLLRAFMDRVNSLLLQCLTMQNKAHQNHSVARSDLDDAWNQIAAKSHAPEYSSAREREARYSVETIDLKIASRAIEREKSDVDYLVEFVKTALRGMDGRRRDIEVLVRAKASAIQLER